MRIKTEITVKYEEPPPPEERIPWYLNPASAIFVVLLSVMFGVLIASSTGSIHGEGWRGVFLISSVTGVVYFMVVWVIASDQSNSVYTYVEGKECRRNLLITFLVSFLMPLLLSVIDFIAIAIGVVLVLIVIGWIFG
jgi:hypothetical protein